MSVHQLTEYFKQAKNLVFFGGAGVSTASGIPDFRSADGLWNQKYGRNLSPEEMVSRSFFERDPEDFFAFYKEKLIYPHAEPNGCHRALARLEEMGKLKAVVTQNIDGLHQKAGNKVVYELHGSVLRNFCIRCHASYDADYILKSPGVPYCRACGSIVKPDVVLYEEMLDEDVIDKAVKAIAKADMLIVGGTSLVVYPAAGFIRYFRGEHLVVINKTATQADEHADLVIHDDIASVMEEAVRGLEAEG
ncbi:MAG: NAD-dependent protein deacylase [Lachnospiraceae bacterium]|nr:NAD-dependent protein deacylase [Lachnospiraceae bacterium]